MPKFLYTVKDSRGRKLTGIITADDKRSAIDTISNKGYFVLKAVAAPQGKGGFSKNVDLDNIIRFTQKLSAMIKAGIPVLNALRMLWEQTEHKGLQVIISDIITDVSQGLPFSYSIKKIPHVFSNTYVSMVEVGEKGGNFAQALDQAIENLTHQREMSIKVKSALIYPAIVLGMAVIVLLVMMAFVVPTFKNVFDKMKLELPGMTQLLIFLSDSFLAYWWIGLILVVAGGFAFWHYSRTPQGSYQIDTIKLKIPFVGKLVYSLSLMQFTHAFHALLASGVHVSVTLENSSKSCGNKRMEEKICFAGESIAKGKSISASLEETGFFPMFYLQMLSIGEASGSILQMLEILLRFLDDEIAYRIHKIFTALGPILIIVVGLIVLFVMVSIYLPIFSLWGSMAY